MYSGEDVRQRQQYSAAQRARDEHTLYVKCVPKSMTSEDVRNLFSPYGEVVNCRILENDGRFSTNRALVGMRSTDACNAAIYELHGREVGRGQNKIYVEFKKLSRYGPNSLPQGAQSSVRGYQQDRRSGYYSGGRGGHRGLYSTDCSVVQKEMRTYYQDIPGPVTSQSQPYEHRLNMYSGEDVRQRQQSSGAHIGGLRGYHQGRRSGYYSEGRGGHSGLYNTDNSGAQLEMSPYHHDRTKYRSAEHPGPSNQSHVRQGSQSSIRGYHLEGRSGYYSEGRGGFSGMYNTDYSGTQLEMSPYHQDIPEYEVWYRHTGQPEIDRIPDLALYEGLDLYPDNPCVRRMAVSDIQRDIGDNYITHLYIRGHIPDRLSELTPHLEQLRLREIPDMRQLDRLADLHSLQVLDMGGNEFSSGVGLTPAVIGKLTNLRVLILEFCGLTDLHEGLADLKSLQVLELGGNKLSSVVTLALIGKLTNLRKLDLRYCGLTDLPEGLADLQTLQVLNLSHNEFSSGVTPAVIGKLTNLRELNLWSCGLTDLHEGLSQLQHLEKLNLSHNSLVTLPQCVSSLTSLQELNLLGNSSLHTLSPDLMKLLNLRKLDCRRCESLKSPPYAVCEQGLDAIRKYYEDLAEQRGKQLPIVSAAVIGNRMAGKTSLIRSLIEQKRVLTYRDVTAETDDTTKVFAINEVPLSDLRLRMFDYGGDKVYHVSHQLAIRSNIIPVVVVNMGQYDELSAEPKEASRQLCMDYMSHLYLPCPSLGAPLLILTHKDKLPSDDLFVTRKDQLIASMENLRQEMLQEERLFANSNNASRFCQIKHFSSKDTPLFHPDDIFVFSNIDEVDNIQSLTQKLEERSKSHVVDIPYLWELMRQYLDDKQDIPFIILSELLAQFPEEGNVIILRYLHNDGRVLWFEREPSLKSFVFHRMDVIVNIITSLFHHKSSQAWTCKIKSLPNAIPFKSGILSKLKYTQLAESFLKSGVIDEALLVRLYDSEGIDSQVAISLLQAFHLVCGPIKSEPRSTFIVPHLSPDLIDLSPINDKLLPLRVCVQFIGLSPPPYVYSLLTCIFLAFFVIPGCRVRSASNGAIVHQAQIVCRLLHNSKARKVTVQIDTPAEQLDTSWRLMIQILDLMLKRLMSIWVAARPICEFFCAHCLYTQEVDPDRLVDPDWYSPLSHTDADKPFSHQIASFSGVYPVDCCNDRSEDGTLTVPLPLRYPCLTLGDQEKTVVQEYVTRLDNSKQSREAKVQAQYPITERYAHILYNPEDRDGAKAEADKFGQSLESAGFHVSTVEWRTAHDQLVRQIIDYIKVLKSDCSLLVISVMSHGRIGMVTGAGYSQVPITDILFHIQTHLGKDIPMVLVVQACQMYRTSGSSPLTESQAGPSTAIDAKGTSPPEKRYIELKRPHSVMMLATVPGGEAVRGAFTGALADEISQADGQTDIHAIFTKASEAISSNSFAQQPVFKSTLRKKLVLPKVNRSGAQK